MFLNSRDAFQNVQKKWRSSLAECGHLPLAFKISSSLRAPLEFDLETMDTFGKVGNKWLIRSLGILFGGQLLGVGTKENTNKSRERPFVDHVDICRLLPVSPCNIIEPPKDGIERFAALPPFHKEHRPCKKNKKQASPQKKVNNTIY